MARSRRFKAAIVVATLFVLVTVVPTLVGLFTDWLWFREVQFTSVFVTVLRTQILLGLVTGVAFFVISAPLLTAGELSER